MNIDLKGVIKNIEDVINKEKDLINKEKDLKKELENFIFEAYTQVVLLILRVDTLRKQPWEIANIKDNDVYEGIISKMPTYFDHYDEALNILSESYYNKFCNDLKDLDECISKLDGRSFEKDECISGLDKCISRLDECVPKYKYLIEKYENLKNEYYTVKVEYDDIKKEFNSKTPKNVLIYMSKAIKYFYCDNIKSVIDCFKTLKEPKDKDITDDDYVELLIAAIMGIHSYFITYNGEKIEQLIRLINKFAYLFINEYGTKADCIKINSTFDFSFNIKEFNEKYFKSYKEFFKDRSSEEKLCDLMEQTEELYSIFDGLKKVMEVMVSIYDDPILDNEFNKKVMGSLEDEQSDMALEEQYKKDKRKILENIAALYGRPILNNELDSLEEKQSDMVLEERRKKVKSEIMEKLDTSYDNQKNDDKKRVIKFFKEIVNEVISEDISDSTDNEDKFFYSILGDFKKLIEIMTYMYGDFELEINETFDDERGIARSKKYKTSGSSVKNGE